MADAPALPNDAASDLDAGLAAMDLGALGRAERDGLIGHARLLMAWTAAVNLTAIRDPRAIVREHILDSLAAVAWLRSNGIDEIIDIGSGGGYPGLPLAIALPARRALLVESIGKKAGFLGTVVRALGLTDRISVVADRAESLAASSEHRESWGAVTARAVAALPDLAELALPLLRVGGLLVAWKRLPTDDEQRAAVGRIHLLGGAPSQIVLPSPVPGLEDHVLIVVRKERPTPVRFPRPPAARRADRR